MAVSIHPCLKRQGILETILIKIYPLYCCNIFSINLILIFSLNFLWFITLFESKISVFSTK